ncbi:RnfH family protein [Catenovulum sp. SM1970]|uniref:RnfH family protein n=1 Tax=Marinifaba aquimaris TaxID=2741323 RepID=UPI001573644B|nr:RnfH family protein [Marinifaba aquimaris]NTS75583.1 RnfH family protein [Marinifaba aquimaris]
MSQNKIQIEVVFALPQKQSLLVVEVDEGETIENCIKASGILALYPEIDLAKNKVGVWSRNRKLTESINEGDRIEIYRPLIADPKEIRRRRAEKAKEEGRADKVTGGRPNKLRSENKA